MIGNFFKARIARIWPAHFFVLILSVILLGGYHENKLSFLASTLMVHTWIPLETFALNFNQPAWSIGTEFFFYACFPLLIYRFSQTWVIKLIIGALIVLGMIFICNKLHLPFFDTYKPDMTCLIYYGPLCRVFEFIVGMATALAYQKWSSKISFSFIAASFLEVTCIAVLILSMRYNFFAYFHIFDHLNSPGYIWATISGGSFLWIAMTIFMLTFQKGIISYILRLPVLITLGEMSYSLYLIHVIFLNYYGVQIAWFKAHFSSVEILVLYWAAILTAAFLIWRFIETPCRHFIRNFTWPLFSAKDVLLKDSIFLDR